MSADPNRGTYADLSTRSVLVTGVAHFAGVLLILAAGFQVLQGISALAKDDVYVKGVDYAFQFDLTTWGWIQLVLGLLGVAIGIGIVMESTVGYLGGIGIGFLAAVSQFAFLPYYPLWSVLIISLDVLVIWALCSSLGRNRVQSPPAT